MIPSAKSQPSGRVQTGCGLKRCAHRWGVIAIIYEARPNVTVDAAALCIKSGNAVVLRGGSGAINSNRVLYEIMRNAIKTAGADPDIVQFIDDVERSSVKELLSYDAYVDVVIPRGGEGLKRFISENSKIPVIASAGGNCHVYVEKTANLAMAKTVAVSAKVSRPSVCNAAEHLLVDRAIAKTFLPEVVKELSEKGVKVTGDAETVEITGVPLASDADFDTEYHDMEMSVKVVSGVAEAIAHINAHGTKHSEAILTSDSDAARSFETGVDAAAVYVNASTRFTDGFEFGFGAEMGISTGKLHARGPIGLRQLTSEKYLIEGNGQIR
jgi:gamma-glutamyl phosphate reductase